MPYESCVIKKEIVKITFFLPAVNFFGSSLHCWLLVSWSESSSETPASQSRSHEGGETATFSWYFIISLKGDEKWEKNRIES